ncbi:MAG: AAA family ATPase [Candidatus Micrarchaeia archaeon]
MLHLEKLTLHNFKSFRQASMKFGEGFNCIVGPNGSGKSSICDAILFSLGETSLKRMRVGNLAQLINNSVKPNPEDDMKRAWVSVTLNGSEQIEITKIVRSDGKVSYRLNGKHVTRQEVIDALHAHRSELESTNTITQGEIIKVLNLNPKERRELIDVAAGIKEFDDKKDAALKELEKVEAKIGEAKIMMNERRGFLDELEKEKRDAEKYTEATNTLKRSNYTILKLRESQLTEEHQKLLASQKAISEKIAEVERSLNANVLKIESLNAEKSKISDELNKRSVEVNSSNHKAEELAKQIAVIREQIKALESSAETAEMELSEKSKEKEAIEAKLKENELNIQKLKSELELKENELKESEAYSLSEEDNEQMMHEYEEQRATAEKLEGELSSLKLEKVSIEGNAKATRGSLEEAKEGLKAALEEYAKIEESVKAYGEEKTVLEDSANALKAKLDELFIEQNKLKGEAGSCEMEILRAKEKISIYGASDKTGQALQKAMKKGFYGRVRDLVTYEPKYTEAVNAAAQSRMNYFVVDTIEDAERAIQILKEGGFERASFIPINDIKVGEQKRINGLKQILDLVKFEDKFESVMNFVFSNTFLIESVGKARSYGIGKARFVTLEGELVESSGVVSGGTAKSVPSISSLNSRLATLEKEKAEISRKMEIIEKEAEELKKEFADKEVKILAIDSESAGSRERLLLLKARIETLKAKISTYERQLEAIASDSEKIDERAKALEKEMIATKAKAGSIYSTISSMMTAKGKASGDKEKRAKAKALREETERLKIGLAATEKESEMMKLRALEVQKEAELNAGRVKEAKEKKKELAEEVEKLEKSKAEVEESIKEHDSKSAALFKKVSEFENEISKLSFEKGKQESELSKMKGELQVQGMSIAQVQTRLSDIKAELLSYQDVIPIDGMSIKELEDKTVLLKAELERLGSVNLKAPEMYEERKKMLEDAEKRLDTLESEKASILSVIDEVEAKKLNVFNETLQKVNENFSKLYPYGFEGEAKLELSDPKDPFNSGLLISITKTKGPRSVDTMSGGEKSFVTLMLLFAIQMMNPMAFYIFDEIDSALDEENSKKLSKMIKELSSRSQFIVVSHNSTLIQAADVAIGVARQDGESRVVGIQIAKQQVEAGASSGKQ